MSIDHGEGPVSVGLYTAIEVIDDTVIERTFGDDSGNSSNRHRRSLARVANTWVRDTCVPVEDLTEAGQVTLYDCQG